MKTSFRQITALNLALLTVGITASFASTPAPAPATTPAASDRAAAKVLSPMEKLQLKNDRDKVLAADPSLKTEAESLKQQRDALSANPNATPEQKKALQTQFQAHKDKVRAAIEKIDPASAALFTKMDAAKKDSHKM